MNAILGIVGFAVLFVIFGLTHRNGRARACDSCALHSSGPPCQACELFNDQSESSHGTP